jgi:hypothetical protein
MTAALLLSRAEAAGLTLAVEGDTLRVRGRATPPAELLADLRRYKKDLLLLLARAQPAAPPAVPRLRRQPSWSDMADIPQPGDTCSCCRHSAWWTEHDAGDRCERSTRPRSSDMTVSLLWWWSAAVWCLLRRRPRRQAGGRGRPRTAWTSGGP